MMEAAPFCPFSSSKIMQYGSKNFLGCRKILMRQSIDGSEWGIFIAGATLRISETAKHESVQSEVWVCKEQSRSLCL